MGAKRLTSLYIPATTNISVCVGLKYIRNYNKSTVETSWDPVNVKNWDEVISATAGLIF